MSRDEWRRTYRKLHQRFFGLRGYRVALRRALERGETADRVTWVFLGNRIAQEVQGVHTLECGRGRTRCRTERRLGRPIDPAWLFAIKEAGRKLRTRVMINGFLFAYGIVRRQEENRLAAHAGSARPVPAE